MAASVGNLAIVISGNSRPFDRAIAKTKSDLRGLTSASYGAFSKPMNSNAAIAFRGLGRIPAAMSAGSKLQDSLAAGFAGGLAGVLAASVTGGFKSVLSAGLGVVSDIGHRAATFMVDSFAEGVSLQRTKLSLAFMAQSPELSASWLKDLRSLSQESGFGISNLARAMQTLAGSTDDLGTVSPMLTSIASIAGTLGADSEQMSRFALAVSQVLAAGRFEGQELNQLSEAGLPLKKLADTAGMSIGEFRKAVQDGAIGVNILVETLNQMGRASFEALNERMKTPLGQLDRLTTSWDTFKASFGEGLLNTAADAGLFTALQNAMDSIAENGPMIVGWLGEGANWLKSWSVEAIRYAGATYDFIQMIRRGVGYLDEMLARLQEFSVPLMVMRNLAFSNPIFAPLNKLDDNPFLKMFDAGTGDRWAKDFAESFEHHMKPAARRVFEEIEIAPQLPSSLQKMLSDAMKTLNEGSPTEQFEKGLKDIKKIAEFMRPKNPFMAGWMKSKGIDTGLDKSLIDTMTQQLRERIFGKEKDKPTPFPEARFAPAAQFGSTEANRILAHAGQGSMQDINNKMLTELKNANKDNAKIAENTKILADVAVNQRHVEFRLN